MNTVKVKKITPWKGPVSIHEGRVLEANMSPAIFNFAGKCTQCGSDFKLVSLDGGHRCTECSYGLIRVKRKRL